MQLRELEADGVMKRKAENTVPKKVEYSLTELGEKAISYHFIDGESNI
ncbi:winged helix-turn-helix transcriptional regulator [Bacillus sp. PK3-136]